MYVCVYYTYIRISMCMNVYACTYVHACVCVQYCVFYLCIQYVLLYIDSVYTATGLYKLQQLHLEKKDCVTLIIFLSRTII